MEHPGHRLYGVERHFYLNNYHVIWGVKMQTAKCKFWFLTLLRTELCLFVRLVWIFSFFLNNAFLSFIEVFIPMLWWRFWRILLMNFLTNSFDEFFINFLKKKFPRIFLTNFLTNFWISLTNVFWRIFKRIWRIFFDEFSNEYFYEFFYELFYL